MRTEHVKSSIPVPLRMKIDARYARVFDELNEQRRLELERRMDRLLLLGSYPRS